MVSFGGLPFIEMNLYWLSLSSDGGRRDHTIALVKGGFSFG